MADEGKRLSRHYHRILATAPDVEQQTASTDRTIPKNVTAPTRNPTQSRPDLEHSYAQSGNALSLLRPNAPRGLRQGIDPLLDSDCFCVFEVEGRVQGFYTGATVSWSRRACPRYGDAGGALEVHGKGIGAAMMKDA